MPDVGKTDASEAADGHTVASPGSDGAGERNGDAHRHDAGPAGRDSPSHAISLGLGLGLGRNVASAVATPPGGNLPQANASQPSEAVRQARSAMRA